MLDEQLNQDEELVRSVIIDRTRTDHQTISTIVEQILLYLKPKASPSIKLREIDFGSEYDLSFVFKFEEPNQDDDVIISKEYFSKLFNNVLNMYAGKYNDSK